MSAKRGLDRGMWTIKAVGVSSEFKALIKKAAER
jgi:hypothetical protein